jgi:hypothetical protein
MSPERRPERRPHRFTLEYVTQLAREVALEHGGHIPTLIVEGSRQPLIGQIPELPPTHEGRVDMMRTMGATLALSGQVGALRQVFFICEGWMSTAHEGEPPVVPPSQDPNRKEVLLISSLKVEGSQSGLVMFEMVRDTEGKLVELPQLPTPQDEGGSVDSPLLDAFAEGFRAGRRRVN